MSAQGDSIAEIPDDISQSIRQRVDQGYNVGIIIGVVNPQGRKYYCYGKTALPDGQPPSENTIFEIGSITKVFTALLLADMAEQAELAFEDPIEKYLPDGIRVPTRNGQSINLAHLATHASGLPRLPDNMASVNLDNPYADYGVEQMYQFLPNYRLPRDIGEKYEYSNYGMGLLGQLLARHSGLTYEQLIRQRITERLGMTDTSITLTPKLQGRLAQGHRGGSKAANWDFPSLAGAGALRSTARDMLTFLAANIGLQDTPLRRAMEHTHKPRCQAGGENLQIGLAWHILTVNDRQIHWHNGGTGGYFSFIGFDKAAQTGIVVLTNSLQSVDDIGFHFFLPYFPLGDYATRAQPGQVVEVPLLPGEKLPMGEDIIKRSIEQIGGHQTLAKARNRLTKAALQMKTFGPGISGSVISYEARPNKWYVKSEILGLCTVQQGSNGQVVWEMNSITGARVLSGREKAAMLLATSFDISNYKELCQTIACVGKAEIEGQMCYKVVFTSKLGSVPFTRYFAIASGVPLKTDYTIEKEKTRIGVETWDSDFKPVDGILYPHHCRTKAMNVITEIYVKSIQHNVQIPPGQFDVPEPVKKILDRAPDKDKELN
jgi:CubicO group peptidase (beta-lactamase class C family)